MQFRANQRKYFKNATTSSKRTLKTCVATQLNKALYLLDNHTGTIIVRESTYLNGI